MFHTASAADKFPKAVVEGSTIFEAEEFVIPVCSQITCELVASYILTDIYSPGFPSDHAIIRTSVGLAANAFVPGNIIPPNVSYVKDTEDLKLIPSSVKPYILFN